MNHYQFLMEKIDGLEKTADLYEQLLSEVKSTTPGFSRHEIALRLIREGQKETSEASE